MNRPNAGRPNRLSQLIHQPGGQTRDEAVRAAEANLEAVRETVLAEIDVALRRMFAIGLAARADFGNGSLDDLYRVANTLIGMAGVFETNGLGAISFSLCSAIDRMRSTGRFDADAVQIHLDSLKFASTPNTKGDRDQAALLAALNRVVERI